MKEVRIDLIELAVNKLLNLIAKGEFMIISVTWIKSLLITLNLEFKNMRILQSIKDAMNYHKKNSKNLNEDLLSDINLIVAYINNKLSVLSYY